MVRLVRPGPHGSGHDTPGALRVTRPTMFAAIPFFQLRVFNLDVPGIGTLPIDPWATLVCIGFVVGLEIARSRAIRLGLEVRDIVDGAVFTVLMGFAVAHLYTVVFYFPERLATSEPLWGLMDPGGNGIWSILRVWEGFASTGGFIGAVIGSWLFYNVLRPRPALRHADVITFGFPFGWFFGRLGCGVVHDHIGRETTFPLAMEFPINHYAAGIRHELGLYEAGLMIPVMALFLLLGRQDRVPGYFLALFVILYAPIRFGLDFLRNDDLSSQDLRYAGLTPAQYGMIVMFFAGLWLFRSLDRERFVPVPTRGAGPPGPETKG